MESNSLLSQKVLIQNEGNQGTTNLLCLWSWGVEVWNALCNIKVDFWKTMAEFPSKYLERKKFLNGMNLITLQGSWKIIFRILCRSGFQKPFMKSWKSHNDLFRLAISQVIETAVCKKSNFSADIAKKTLPVLSK